MKEKLIVSPLCVLIGAWEARRRLLAGAVVFVSVATLGYAFGALSPGHDAVRLVVFSLAAAVIGVWAR